MCFESPKLVCSRGSALDPAEGTYSTPPYPLAGFGESVEGKQREE